MKKQYVYTDEFCERMTEEEYSIYKKRYSTSRNLYKIDPFMEAYYIQRMNKAMDKCDDMIKLALDKLRNNTKA